MTAKELKRLGRKDLLEMLLALSKENEALKAELAETQAQLEKREIQIADSESLADAVLRLNCVFEAAQKACEQYQENLRMRCERQEEVSTL